jgi:hypothetical protein
MRLLASGRDADVWALDAERVLRRYRDRRDMSRETEVMRRAAAHGFPVPRVLDTPPDGMQLAAAVARRTANPTLSPAEKANLPAAARLVRSRTED